MDIQKAKEYGETIVRTVTKIEQLQTVSGNLENLYILTNSLSIDLKDIIPHDAFSEIEELAKGVCEKYISEFNKSLEEMLPNDSVQVEPAKRKAHTPSN